MSHSYVINRRDDCDLFPLGLLRESGRHAGKHHQYRIAYESSGPSLAICPIAQPHIEIGRVLRPVGQQDANIIRGDGEHRTGKEKRNALPARNTLTSCRQSQSLSSPLNNLCRILRTFSSSPTSPAVFWKNAVIARSKLVSLQVFFFPYLGWRARTR